MKPFIVGYLEKTSLHALHVGPMLFVLFIYYLTIL